MNSIKTLNILILFILNVSIVSSQTKNSYQKDKVEYFFKRSAAVNLVKKGKWQEAIPILEGLKKLNQNDSDIFYLLGLSYYELKEYQKAIIALKKTLDLGGTILRGIPKGSAPSNDIMIKIAKAYAKDEDKNNALLWLQKGFAARYDEKPFLKGSSAFKKFSEDVDYERLFGINTKKNMTRNDEWSQDLLYLEKRINELHYRLKNPISKEISEIKKDIPLLSDEQIVAKIMKVVGSLGNGHNLIIPTSTKKNTLKRLPVQFYQFNDGVFIVDADEGFQQWVGCKVDAIGNTPISEALEKTNVVNARDNDMQTLWLGSYYLRLPDVLEDLGIVKDAKQVTVTLVNPKGKSQKVTMEPVSWNFTDFPKLPKLKNEQQPLFLSNKENPYWYKLLPEVNSIYIQFNIVTQKKTQSLEEFNLEVQNQMTQNGIENLILDLRHNHGGNGSILPPMLRTMINFEVMNRKGKLFVVIGRETFSAAQNLLTEITKYTNPIIVGEPSGSKPNHIGEAGWFKLPYSGLMGIISTQFHQTSKAEDYRKWIAPHIPVDLSSIDYFKGNDRIMNIIMEVIRADNN
ncbi:Anaphase-promoting complex, cyclosome, subunit 3 [Tenacibaculum sp. MAR_2009_124]|uniref:CDC27 family protein n=1 Tax=Tenacibaculum sp. MAR_2009_124 TaxID=1250059 RepID=UPI00089B1B3D|nr:CDC27 family protein [Tenacibaculum sp. MAR_2009_124]SEB81786.1 Anaphase-promoting complex, cyclosome, subunit 3 [Tenacibaculum sp. MAR_2009_124]